MISIPFVKMHGCGNDYLFSDAGLTRAPRTELLQGDLPEIARLMSHRHTGVGSDGLIVLSPGENTPVRMQMFNADGSEGRLCLNGLRCAAKYTYDRLPDLEPRFPIETKAGIRHVEVQSVDRYHTATVTVNAGQAEFARKAIPATGDDPEFWGEYLVTKGGEFLGYGVSVGNPHLVLLPTHRDDQNVPASDNDIQSVSVDVTDLSSLNMPLIGRPLEISPWFPEGVNVHVALADGDRLPMRSWERGSGETQACGTGAVAVFAVMRRLKKVGPKAEIEMPGGSVYLEEHVDGVLEMRGPAVEVCEGVWTGI